MRFNIYILIVIIVAVFGLIYFLGKGGSLGKSKSFLNKNKSMVETVKIKTQDGIEIVGDYYDTSSDKGVILLHMMPADRKSWTKFALKLRAKNFKVLAIDLRGHGESTNKITNDKLQISNLDYRKFTDKEHQESILDVESGAGFLKEKGVKDLHLVGASIGANLALKYLVEHPEIKSAILLSPGLDYRGLKTEPLAPSVKLNQAVYFVGSSEDIRSSGQSAVEMAETLFRLCNCKKSIKKFNNAGHGTNIFEKEPEFMDEIINWYGVINK